MKRIFFLIILSTLLFTTNVSGQLREMQTDTVEFFSYEVGDTTFVFSQLRVILSDTIVKLAKEIDDTKTVILLKNRNFEVKVSLSDFEKNVNNDYWSKKMLEKVLRKAESRNIVNVSKIRNRNMQERLEFIIANLLKKGQCLILNKRTNEIMPEIRCQYYRFGVVQGRRFLVNNILILETIDIRAAANNIDPIIKRIEIRE